MEGNFIAIGPDGLAATNSLKSATSDGTGSSSSDRADHIEDLTIGQSVMTMSIKSHEGRDEILGLHNIVNDDFRLLISK